MTDILEAPADTRLPYRVLPPPPATEPIIMNLTEAEAEALPMAEVVNPPPLPKWMADLEP